MFLGRYMSDNQDNELPEGKIEGTINAVTGLVKAVPVYEDAIQPVAKETAKPFKQLGRLSMLRYFLFEASFGA
jgi:hypothetical protein